MYNKSLSARNEETVKKAKIKTEDNSQKVRITLNRTSNNFN